MLQNAYFLAKIGADTAENEQHFAEILPIGRCVADHRTEALVVISRRDYALPGPDVLRTIPANCRMKNVRIPSHFVHLSHVFHISS